MPSLTEVCFPVRCIDCAAELAPDRRPFGRCFACNLGVHLRAQRAAYRERDWATANCASCAAGFNLAGPPDGRLCDDCRRAHSIKDQS